MTGIDASTVQNSERSSLNTKPDGPMASEPMNSGDDVFDELVEDYSKQGGSMPPQKTLIAMAEEAQYGLQQAILDTVADMMVFVSMQSTDTCMEYISTVTRAWKLESIALHILRRVVPITKIQKSTAIHQSCICSVPVTSFGLRR